MNFTKCLKTIFHNPFSSTRRTMAEIEVRDYKALKTTPSGSTVSLFPDNGRLYNMADVETKVLFPDNVNNWKDAVVMTTTGSLPTQ